MCCLHVLCIIAGYSNLFDNLVYVAKVSECLIGHAHFCQQPFHFKMAWIFLLLPFPICHAFHLAYVSKK